MTAPRQADASTQPCQMRTSHNPTPVRTQSHHRFPEYLQRRLWGEVRLQDRWDLCGTDHDSTHAWIGWLLGEQYQPTLNPGTFIKVEAERVMAWYESEKKLLGYGSGRYGSGPYGVGSYSLKGDPDAQWDGIE